MKQTKRRSAKRFFDLTPEERDQDVARFDKPIDLEKDTRPLTAKERARFEKAMAKPPLVSLLVHSGQRDEIVHLDDELLVRAKAYARKNKTSLPKMIDRGLRGLLAFTE